LHLEKPFLPNLPGSSHQMVPVTLEEVALEGRTTLPSGFDGNRSRARGAMRKLIGFSRLAVITAVPVRMKTSRPTSSARNAGHGPAKLRPCNWLLLAVHSIEFTFTPETCSIHRVGIDRENQYYPVPTRVLEDGTVRLPLVGPSPWPAEHTGAEQAIFATYSVKDAQEAASHRRLREPARFGSMSWAPSISPANTSSMPRGGLLSALVSSGD